ncbi:MAG: type I secretion system permease/ATPase [Cohaesibacter sp.]|nr:type I secretion system permease/ATPase [Cohaesibacter sp.]
MQPQSKKSSPLKQAIQSCRWHFLAIGLFSLFINLLMFVGPLYMLQIYDRVLASRSEVTLIAITALAGGFLLTYGLLESVRSRMLVRIGVRFDAMLNEKVFRTIFTAFRRAPQSQVSGALRDLNIVREFMTGGAIIAFFDAPWVPIFIAFGFLLHPYLGLVSVAGGLIILVLALINEFSTRNLLAEASGYSRDASLNLNQSLRNAETAQAMGMISGVFNRWKDAHINAMILQTNASDRAGLLVAGTKFVRMALQVVILGVGAYLAIGGEISPGAMIAASIIMGRALAPIEMAVGQWKNVVAARGARTRLEEMFIAMPEQEQPMSLPAPEGHLSFEQVTIAPPGTRHATLKAVTLDIEPGTLVGVVGPSGSGKSTFARAAVGIWSPLAGAVRLDGAEYSAWDSEQLGPYVGYLPQEVELFSGTVAENIARFGEIDPEKVVTAAKAANVHELILQLPQAYDTSIGEAGRSLSGGQRQRIALARALYGHPKLVVLDEPNSNLDNEGEAALVEAMIAMRNQGATVLAITHRTSFLKSVDKILVLSDGVMSMYGDAPSVIQRLSELSKNKAKPRSVEPSGVVSIRP